MAIVVKKSSDLFHALEQTIPRFGTDNSTLWNGQFHALGQTVPRFGIIVVQLLVLCLS